MHHPVITVAFQSATGIIFLNKEPAGTNSKPVPLFSSHDEAEQFKALSTDEQQNLIDYSIKKAFLKRTLTNAGIVKDLVINIGLIWEDPFSTPLTVREAVVLHQHATDYSVANRISGMFDRSLFEYELITVENMNTIEQLLNVYGLSLDMDLEPFPYENKK